MGFSEGKLCSDSFIHVMFLKRMSKIVLVSTLILLGDSRKYPYHTTDGFKDFRRGGGIHDYGILKAWGGGGVFTI